jgi:hypothetical protein
LVPRQPTRLGGVRAVGHIKLDDAEHFDRAVVTILCNPIVVSHVRWDAGFVVFVVTGHRDLGSTIVLMLDTYTHLVLAVVVKDLLDVFLCEALVREELASGVGVPFEESCDSVDYCVLFHDEKGFL